MKKIYVKKLSSSEAKEIFMGEKYTKIKYNDKEVNLIGILDNAKEFYIYSGLNMDRCLGYGERISEENELIITENVKGQFLVIK